MSTATAEQTSHIVNGIDTDQVVKLATRLASDENYGKFKWRANNQWIGGSRSHTTIQNFFAGGEENTSRKQPLIIGADQPAFLAGDNTSPNSVEYLLHALTSCLNTTLVYHASVQGIPLDEVIVNAEGDMDARGFFGISDEVNKGYEHIRVDMQVKSPADAETLTTLAMHSPVYEVVSRSVPVEFKLTKI